MVVFAKTICAVLVHLQTPIFSRLMARRTALLAVAVKDEDKLTRLLLPLVDGPCFVKGKLGTRAGGCD
jgi:hypothetical protein